MDKLRKADLPEDIQTDVDDMDQTVEDLIGHFGEEFREEITDSYSMTGGYSNLGESGTFTADGTEYVWISSTEEADDIAQALVKEDLENEPELFSQDWLEGHLYITDTDRRIIANEEADSRVDDASSVRDLISLAQQYEIDAPVKDYGLYTLEENTDGTWRILDDEGSTTLGPDYASEGEAQDALDSMSNEEPDYEDLREEIREKISDQVEEDLKDPVQYFVHDHGLYTVGDLLKQSFITIDYEEAAKDAVSTDGFAHFLSRYSGNYEETQNGIVFFRET
jgi:hypothetical protein